MPSARRELSLKEKVDLIKSSDGKSCRQLSEMFGVGKTQVSTILKRKAELMAAHEENVSSDKKRLKLPGDLQDIDEMTWKT